MRLDRALVARGLARSRTHAQRLIDDGRVLIDGRGNLKASFDVPDGAVIVVDDDPYVSRAAHKLIGALDACAPLGLTVAGRNALDAGASTGGFTQVLLERGAAHVTAIDVGHGQLASTVQNDPRVTAIEGLNVRDLTPAVIETRPDVVVADLSFISLTLAVGPLVAVANEPLDLVLMVKPQFEVGRERLGKDGVVTNVDDRASAVAGVVASLRHNGCAIHAVSTSVLPGPTGNVEFFVWASRAWQASGAGHERPVLGDAAAAAAIERETGGRL